MKIEQIMSRPTERYPWIYRVEPDLQHHQFPMLQWTEQEKLPGLWAGGAFYTDAETVTLILLVWGHV